MRDSRAASRLRTADGGKHKPTLKQNRRERERGKMEEDKRVTATDTHTDAHRHTKGGEEM